MSVVFFLGYPAIIICGSGSVEGEVNLRTTVRNHKRKVPNKKPTLSGGYEASKRISAWGVPGLSQRRQKKLQTVKS